MHAPLGLHSDRLLLLAPRSSDVDEIFRCYAADPEVTQYLGFPRHTSREDAEAFLQFSQDSWARDGVGPFLIRDRTDRVLLGSTGLAVHADGSAMTGYVLAKHCWGKGYATEALNIMIDLGRKMGLRELFAFCHADHEHSRRVLEKCHFIRDTAWTGELSFPNLEPPRSRRAYRYAREL